jgi:hypothetical protein
LMIAYGYPVNDKNDPYVALVEASVNGFSESLEPGAFLVDVIPARESLFLLLPPKKSPSAEMLNLFITNPLRYETVRYVPDWFPGTGWKVKAKRFANLLTDMAEIPLQFVRDQMVSR